MPFFQGIEELLRGGDGSADHLVEVLKPCLEKVGAIDCECFIRTEGGVDFGGVVAGIVGSVVFEGVVGVVGGAHGRDIELLQKALRGEVGVLQTLVGTVPDLVCGLGREESFDAESAAEFEMSPVVEWVTQSIGDGGGPSVELFAVARVTGDVAFGNAVGTHCPPLVVIVLEPDLGDVFPAVIVMYLVGREVGMIVEDRLFGRGLVVEVACGFVTEKKVVVEIGHDAREKRALRAK